MTTPKPINSFSNEYTFLSNFYPVDVIWMSVLYPSVEHAYQAAKSIDPTVRQHFATIKTPGQAKREGRIIDIRPDWEDIKIDVMRKLLIQKFNHKELYEKLIATSPAELIEGNWWGDRFWGVCRGEGKNHLGKLLMEIRDTNDFFL